MNGFYVSLKTTITFDFMIKLSTNYLFNSVMDSVDVPLKVILGAGFVFTL